MKQVFFDNGRFIARDIVSDEYVHIQNVPSAVWDIQHNLNKFPSVTVIDSAGNYVYCDVQRIDDNNIRIISSWEFSGKAYLT